MKTRLVLLSFFMFCLSGCESYFKSNLKDISGPSVTHFEDFSTYIDGDMATNYPNLWLTNTQNNLPGVIDGGSLKTTGPGNYAALDYRPVQNFTIGKISATQRTHGDGAIFQINILFYIADPDDINVRYECNFASDTVDIRVGITAPMGNTGTVTTGLTLNNAATYTFACEITNKQILISVNEIVYAIYNLVPGDELPNAHIILGVGGTSDTKSFKIVQPTR